MSDVAVRDVHSAFFDLLEREDFEEGKFWRRQAYKNNDVILKEGSYSGKVFVVIEGATRIVGSVAMGEDYQVRPGVRDLGRGDVFGEFSMLDHAPHSATVIAISDCELAVIDNESLLAFMEKDHEAGYEIYRELAHRLVDRLRKADKQVFSLLAWGLKAHGYDKYMK